MVSNDFYTVLKDEVMLPHKRTVEVLLQERLNVQELQVLGLFLTEQNRQPVERVFIGYRIEGGDPDSAYWATTHSNPDFEIRIAGLTADEYNVFKAYDPTAHYNNVMGAWVIENGFNYIAVAYEKDGQVYVDDVFPGKGAYTALHETSELKEGGLKLQRADDEFGEYYVIDEVGDLQFWSENGNYFTATPL
ncbi:hypothetical protein [Vreelandella populi]|uniref:Uncharacterized protein n=1 Tax=Vreelandella populi TaxID=2498858 RepID=A0A3S0YCA1_9GAMM|nr:hypothetical protein [Halomonas populi]RUR46220.1 hypothetical protein ELY37_09530 [Halomonas populi]